MMNFLEDFRVAVAQGLSGALVGEFARGQKSIPCRFLYDAYGSQLFSRITKLEDYYPTRSEKEILSSFGPEVSAILPVGVTVVELGSGTSEKTPLLLSALKAPAAYVPVDIDDGTLDAASQMIRAQFPRLNVVPVHADFTRKFDLPINIVPPVLGFFPGSTIGNFTVAQARAFLLKLRKSLGQSAYLLVGADLIKDVDTLERAYDDREGVTAEFNKNLLTRINRELSGNFDVDAFQHRAIWNDKVNAVQMFLESKKAQTVTVAGHTYSFEAGESIHTEDSHKYSREGFHSLVSGSGWSPVREWCSKGDLFGLYLIKAV